MMCAYHSLLQPWIAPTGHDMCLAFPIATINSPQRPWSVPIIPYFNNQYKYSRPLKGYDMSLSFHDAAKNQCNIPIAWHDNI